MVLAAQGRAFRRFATVGSPPQCHHPHEGMVHAHRSPRVSDEVSLAKGVAKDTDPARRRAGRPAVGNGGGITV